MNFYFLKWKATEFRVIYADEVGYMDLVFIYISSCGKGIVNLFTILTSRTNTLQKHLVSVLGQSNSSGKSDNIIMLLFPGTTNHHAAFFRLSLFLNYFCKFSPLFFTECYSVKRRG
jgi:hypothetical protein